MKEAKEFVQGKKKEKKMCVSQVKNAGVKYALAIIRINKKLDAKFQ